MQTMNVTVETERVVRTWPRIERYQNSTLRYTPPADFPAFWASVNGRPKIIRTWITLDEVWDYRTDDGTGITRSASTATRTTPTTTHTTGGRRAHPNPFQDYLKSYTAMADEALLNIRRYERETADGIVPTSATKRSASGCIEHCRQLCPNIRYIEVSNESEISVFGGIRSRSTCRFTTGLPRRQPP
jgi:hypothetical protein